MKRLLLGLFIIISISIMGCRIGSGNDIKYIGSNKSNKYHYQTCYWAKKISPYNAVFFSNAEEAIKKGYIPCKVCRPPVKEKNE